jgi:predicted DCC family thiol-disulfide oxidoreductase YuxK
MKDRERPAFLAPDDCVVLFDGVCNLCNRSVQFILRHDPSDRLKFAALQSDAGRELLRWSGQQPDQLDTLIFIEHGRAYSRSTAVLRIARYLRWPWPAFALLVFLPQQLRDWCYDRVARNRYALFGKSEACMMPTPELRRRFL